MAAADNNDHTGNCQDAFMMLLGTFQAFLGHFF